MYVYDFRNTFGKTYNVVLGAGQVVIGMEEGLLGMCVGEKRKLVIPPHLAYGERGVGKMLLLQSQKQTDIHIFPNIYVYMVLKFA